ncbi:hypothetical protein DPSP01_008208 [Paraphaeosphaeria sporulosa]
MAMGSTSISKAQYNIMSSLDGTRTASSFEHSFRSIIKKAKELQARVDAGETFEAVAPAKKRGGASGGATPPTTPKKPKATPKKTPKATPNGRGKKGMIADEASLTPGKDLKSLEFEQDFDLEGDFQGFKEDLEDDLI